MQTANILRRTTTGDVSTVTGYLRARHPHLRFGRRVGRGAGRWRVGNGPIESDIEDTRVKIAIDRRPQDPVSRFLFFADP